MLTSFDERRKNSFKTQENCKKVLILILGAMHTPQTIQDQNVKFCWPARGFRVSGKIIWKWSNQTRRRSLIKKYSVLPKKICQKVLKLIKGLLVCSKHAAKCLMSNRYFPVAIWYLEEKAKDFWKFFS